MNAVARLNPLARLAAAWGRWAEQRERDRVRSVPIRDYTGAGRPTRLGGIDAALIGIVLCLLGFSLVMVYSASIALPDSRKFAHLAPTHFMARQAVAIGVGLVLAAIALRIPMSLWERGAPWLFAAALVLLALVLIPAIGKGVNGARRWMPLGPINFQPSELAKLAMALYAASYMLRKMEVKERFVKAMWPMAVALAVVGLLLLAEPDMGAYLVIASIALGILFLGGVNGRMFALSVLVLLTAFVAMILLSPWRRERLFAFLDPWDPVYSQGKGYQLTHSLIAFGRGELAGQGLGESLEKLHYLPEAHTDFVLAVIGEELGFIGVCAVICAFFFLTRRIFAIGRQAVALDRVFAGLAVQGIGVWVGVQALINIGVNLGALPTKGLTLPLVSYGGSAVMLTLMALGVVLRADLENRQLMRGGRA